MYRIYACHIQLNNSSWAEPQGSKAQGNILPDRRREKSRVLGYHLVPSESEQHSERASGDEAIRMQFSHWNIRTWDLFDGLDYVWTSD